jgi:Tol biopolymer transport system component
MRCGVNGRTRVNRFSASGRHAPTLTPRSMPKPDFRAAALALLLAAAACDSPSETGPPPAGTPGVTVVSGAGVADTVDAMLPQPLVVQVNGSDGRPLADAEVGFFVTAIREGSDQPTVLVSPTRGSGGGSYVVERTDGEGRAAVRVRMFRYAMQGGVLVAVPAVDDFVIASYTIQPGAPRTLSTAPADTAVLAGGSFALAATARDRHGNARPAQGVAFRVASGPATLAGSTVLGTAVGRAAVVAELAGASDTTYVSVVPAGTIAAYTAAALSSQKATLYTLRLDGSGLAPRVTTGAGDGYNATMGSAWSADGTRLYYHDSNTDHTRSMHVLELATGTTRRLLPAADRMLEEAWPRFAGGWVYFEGGSFDDRLLGTVTEPLLYRVRPDGTGRQQVTAAAGIGTARHGAPSPDGSRIAFIGSYSSPMPLHVLDVATGGVRSLGVAALSPRWRPDGGEIFYVASGDLVSGSGQIRAIRPDGTADRAVTLPGTKFGAHFDLSPDGEYLIASTDQGVLTLVQVATGVEMPIRTPSITQRMMAPSWGP